MTHTTFKKSAKTQQVKINRPSLRTVNSLGKVWGSGWLAEGAVYFRPWLQAGMQGEGRVCQRYSLGAPVKMMENRLIIMVTA